MTAARHARRFAALRTALAKVARKRPVNRSDCLVTRAGRLRCEAWVDPLDAETPFTIEVSGGLFPIRIHARDVPVALDALHRYARERADLNRLFAFPEPTP